MIYLDIKSESASGHIKLSNGDQIFPCARTGREGIWGFEDKRSHYVNVFSCTSREYALAWYQDRTGNCIL